jgi:ribA/ribD-fused uncharacterized protein
MLRSKRLEQDGDLDPILFYKPRDEYGCFSNFSLHTIVLPDPWTWEMRAYPTGEHRYQALKSDDQEGHEYVMEIGNPGAAQKRGRQVNLREGWREDHLGLGYYVMLELVIAKTVQHSFVQRELASTGDHIIYEDSPVDDIWGWRYSNDYSGKNLLGVCWMQSRALFR